MIFGKFEKKITAFSHCPSCQLKLEEEVLVFPGTISLLCFRCELRVGMEIDRLEFFVELIEPKIFFEEEFERYLKLRSFE